MTTTLKRGEARAAIRRCVLVPAEDRTAFQLAKEIVDEAACDRIIEALGVIVEPDEPTLPSHVVAKFDGYRDRRSSVTVTGSGSVDATRFKVTIAYSDLYGGRLCDSLVTTYNNCRRSADSAIVSSSQWRTGDPPGIDDYAVIVEDANAVPLLVGRVAVIARWDRRWFFPPTFKVATARVVGWQPLPE